ncbi:winged helix-turn-helix domain-containing protein, partial [Streptomyces boluensis]
SSPAAPLKRHHLRAIGRDEMVDVAEFLPPGATWLPAPQHTVPTLPGHPPMIGYLVLVPADQLPGRRPGPQAGQQPLPQPTPQPGQHPGQRPGFASAAPAAHPQAPRAAQVAHAPTVPDAVRTEASHSSADELVHIDPVQRTAQVDGHRLDLTYLEFELLAHLVAHPHRVHTRDQLVTTVWGYGHVGDGRTVDVHVARLRRKLGADHRQAIQTVRRVGYKYAPPTTR